MDSNASAITVSSLDLARLESLLDSASARDAEGATALRRELARARVVEPADMPDDVVSMNSTVRVVDAADGSERELTLAYPRDADGTRGRVSVLAPVGSAMLGLRVGQSIEWPLPGGRTAHLRIAGIRYQPEASGDLHR